MPTDGVLVDRADLEHLYDMAACSRPESELKREDYAALNRIDSALAVYDAACDSRPEPQPTTADDALVEAVCEHMRVNGQWITPTSGSDALAAVAAAGRLVPAGGVALTAEQAALARDAIQAGPEHIPDDQFDRLLDALGAGR